VQLVVNYLAVGIYYNPLRQDLQEPRALLLKTPVQRLGTGK
jgi:hypothetical protein